jgi:hypothetical protein
MANTGSDSVNEGANSATVVPIIGEIGNGHIGNLALNPSNQSIDVD